jgi:signal transduction histidine kinase/integral membrane sensor domain MASE1
VSRFAKAISRPPGSLAAIAALVGFGYYVGAQIGLALTFPPSTTSVLWPPNAVLTAALLLVPPRHWWICLAAALPGHVLLESAAGFPSLLIGLLFLTNCSEALIAAGGVRAFSDDPIRLDSVRRVLVFIAVAGLAAPILSSFADAAVVHELTGDPYWSVWRARMFANVLTELAVAPAIVLGVRALRRAPGLVAAPHRIVEALALAAAIYGAGMVVFGPPSLRDNLPIAPSTPIILTLPLFGWAAMRFGVGGVSAALLLAAVVASVQARAGHRPFAQLPPADSLLAVQMILSVISMPLMCVAGLLAEHRRARAALASRLQFEALLSSLSAPSLPGADDAHDELRLARACEYLRLDRAVILRLDEGSGELEVERQWHADGRRPLDGPFAPRFPSALAHAGRGETVAWSTIDDVPASAARDRQSFAELGLRSMVVLPFASGASVRGALWAGTAGRRVVSPACLGQLRLIVDVVANARLRRAAEQEAQRSRQELAHIARRSSLGELAASLAHQLNQPLTGILSTAQAARRLVAAGTASTDMLKESLDDMIDDCGRASDVIRRMREMLTPADAAPAVLDLAALVSDVGLLLVSDAHSHRVSLTMESPRGEPARVEGVRVLLQQAVLNVIINAIDAVSDVPLQRRVVSIRTLSDRSGRVRVMVRDYGTGLPPGAEQQVFEPFFSTKPTGVGMGLAISRSIVENHGGSIAARTEPEGGTLVTISLPAVA